MSDNELEIMFMIFFTSIYYLLYLKIIYFIYNKVDLVFSAVYYPIGIYAAYKRSFKSLN
jgi:hypothetical protein